MSSTPTTFDVNSITVTSFTQPAAGQDSEVSTLVTGATQVSNINTVNFLTLVDSDFYQSQIYNQVITQKNPPPTSSYAKDPTGANDDSVDPDLNFPDYAKLAPGQVQIIVHGDQSALIADQNYFLTVGGTLQTGYDGNRNEMMFGKVNQKYYNGTKSIYNGESIRFFDQLVTSYEHQNVSTQSFVSDTIIHFGERTILRKGDENQEVHGTSNVFNYGNTTTNLYGDSIVTIDGTRTIKTDHVINVKTVAGLRTEVTVGLVTHAVLGAFLTFNNLFLVVAVKEQLIGIFHGKIEGVTLDGWVTGLETYGFGGKVVGICLRAIAGVFGILRP